MGRFPRMKTLWITFHSTFGWLGALGAVWLGSSLWRVQACVQGVGSTFSQVEEPRRNCRLKAT